MYYYISLLIISGVLGLFACWFLDYLRLVKATVHLSERRSGTRMGPDLRKGQAWASARVREGTVETRSRRSPFFKSPHIT